MPINVCDWHYRSFVKAGGARGATSSGIGVIGMKSLGGGSDGKGRLRRRQASAPPRRRIRFALSQDIASLVVGIDSMEVLKQDLAHRPRRSSRSTEAELKKLLAKVKAVAGDGRHERFKSTQLFDGPYHQKQHGLTPEEVEAP